MSDTRKRILIVIDWFLPGYRGGGPITSVANLIQALGHQYAFSIITSDRDYGAKEPYVGIVPDQWVQHNENVRVYYCSREGSSYRHFRKLISETEFDLLYLQSMFSLRYTIFPLWNSRSMKPDVPVLLAPRGMLHAGALSLKPLKKKIFLQALRLTKIAEQISFQATDAQEEQDIKAVFGEGTKVLRAANLPRMTQTPFLSIPKEPGKLKLVFLSRLTAKKGLHQVLELLKSVRAEVELDIIGPDEEAGYWARCAAIVAGLPAHVQVRKHAPLPPEEAYARLQAAHAFVMPTLGENFGHAIFEAFCAGRPAIISDQTPWRGLAPRQLGMDIALDRPEEMRAAIEQMAAMPQAEWEAWGKAAWAFAAAYIAQPTLLREQIAMFESIFQH